MKTVYRLEKAVKGLGKDVPIGEKVEVSISVLKKHQVNTAPGICVVAKNGSRFEILKSEPDTGQILKRVMDFDTCKKVWKNNKKLGGRIRDKKECSRCKHYAENCEARKHDQSMGSAMQSVNNLFSGRR